MVVARKARVPSAIAEVADSGTPRLPHADDHHEVHQRRHHRPGNRIFPDHRSEHGSMVDILGVGTLIRGASGIGKSECVLSLLERGYSLVSDDITRFRASKAAISSACPRKFHASTWKSAASESSTSPPPSASGSIRPEKRLDFVVTLKEWHECEEIDRIGLDSQTYEILGVPVPHVTIPVRTGRDLGRLVEVAALDQKLKSMGHHSALEFNQRLLQFMRPADESTNS
jgi:HPr kinase/phosphorylase